MSPHNEEGDGRSSLVLDHKEDIELSAKLELNLTSLINAVEIPKLKSNFLGGEIDVLKGNLTSLINAVEIPKL